MTLFGLSRGHRIPKQGRFGAATTANSDIRESASPTVRERWGVDHKVALQDLRQMTILGIVKTRVDKVYPDDEDNYLVKGFRNPWTPLCVGGRIPLHHP